MSTRELSPRFQLAFRRSLFFGLCLCVWLAIGTFTFSALSATVGRHRANLASMVRLDNKRTELLNVLWAETIAKPEADWAEMANKKLELYEKALLNYMGCYEDTNDRSFVESLRKSVSLVTTIGPINIDMFTITGKIFTVIYATIGVPLCLLLLTQCGRMITSIWEGKTLIIPVICYIFVSAVIYDVIEDRDDDVPFFDAIFSVFLQFSTIGQTEKEFYGIIPYIITFIGVALVSKAFFHMQHEIERLLYGFEFAFTSVFSKFERWMSDDKGITLNSNRIEEVDEDEDESDY
ncbi:hypothetical protein KIN20_008247 [Parelaphostrongylus tenuis]|uniref:Potassium channel domain-containing protein n=1 Tax=Parelaphostrongylus tenuis TaxID=148309 RepID=A0AAD5M7P5_PARTN|nr:hypothetical protein KIN20_008247 [Parelaphostrongylus tenuis]